MVNIRQKGAGGEREIADELNFIVYKEMQAFGLTPLINTIQRNQNQTAVGGSDLTGTMGLSIEVKRQETLNINTWWVQCIESAKRSNETPVLIYRQSRKPWYVVMNVDVPLFTQDAQHAHMRIRATFNWEPFKTYFAEHVRRKLRAGYIPTI
jgi:hypothetical protein